jgi:uncharacterized protein YjbI with pentapeptide repeats
MIRITPEQLQEIFAKHLAWQRGEPEGERANLGGANLGGANFEGANFEGAYLEGANFEDCQMNWQSHDLIATRLLQAAGDDAYKRLAAGYILVSRDWCWDALMENVPEQVKDLLPWALSEMATWVKEGDGAPNILKRAAKSETVGEN